MRTRYVLLGITVVALLVVIGFELANAQDAPRRRRFDPAQMRERMMQRIKEAAQIGDEEWKVLKPRIEKVQTLARDAGTRGGRRMGFGRRRRRANTENAEQPADAPPQSDVVKAFQALQKTLENEAATPAEIKGKMKTLREAREKAKQELVKAREAVRELVTVRQEGQLVVLGILD